MALYVDKHCVLDTDYLVCAIKADGEGQYDGHHSMALLLHVEGKSKRLFVEYPNMQTRDAALEALGALLVDELGTAAVEEVPDGDDVS